MRVLTTFANACRRFGPAAVAFTIAGCAGLGPNLASQTPSSVPLAGAKALIAPVGSRVITVPIVMGGRLTLPPLHRAFRHGSASPAARRPKNVLYVGNEVSGMVLLYNSNKATPKPFGEIIDGLLCPSGVAVDNAGNVYVADECTYGYNGSVTVYPAGQQSPTLTITTGIEAPYGIAVDSNGNVFVSNLDANDVTAYAAGQTTPYETISGSQFGTYAQPVGLAVDSSNNLWVASDENSTVYEVPAGSSQPENAGLSDLKGPSGMSFDANGNLYVTNFAANSAGIYPPGSQTPTTTITDGMSGPTANTVTAAGKFFQGNQGLNPPFGGSVQGYLPGKTEPSSFIVISETQGLAVWPSAHAQHQRHHR